MNRIIFIFSKSIEYLSKLNKIYYSVNSVFQFCITKQFITIFKDICNISYTLFKYIFKQYRFLIDFYFWIKPQRVHNTFHCNYRNLRSSKMVFQLRRTLVQKVLFEFFENLTVQLNSCLLYTSPSPRDLSTSRMPSSA